MSAARMAASRRPICGSSISPLEDTSSARNLPSLSPDIPVCPSTSRDPGTRLELSSGVVSHTEVDHLSHVIGNPKKGRYLLLVIEMKGRPGRAEAAGAQRKHQ